MSQPRAITRRSAVRGMAWSVPAVAVISASPAHAASKKVDLHVTARVPVEARDGELNGYSVYRGVRVLSFRYTFGNKGTDVMPAGALLAIGLPFAVIWDTATMAPDVSRSGAEAASMVLVDTSTVTVAVAEGGIPGMVRRLWTYRLGVPIQPGASFDIYFSVTLNATSNASTDHWRVRTFGSISVGAAGPSDVDGSNDTDFSDNYLLFNKS